MIRLGMPSRLQNTGRHSPRRWSVLCARSGSLEAPLWIPIQCAAVALQQLILWCFLAVPRQNTRRTSSAGFATSTLHEQTQGSSKSSGVVADRIEEL